MVEVREEYVGAVVDMLAQRKGQMLDLTTNPGTGTSTVKYSIPTRGLLGLKTGLLTATRGTAIINTIFSHFDEWMVCGLTAAHDCWRRALGPFSVFEIVHRLQGDINTRDQGSLVAHETGAVTTFACESAQARGIVSPLAVPTPPHRNLPGQTRTWGSVGAACGSGPSREAACTLLLVATGLDCPLGFPLAALLQAGRKRVRGPGGGHPPTPRGFEGDSPFQLR